MPNVISRSGARPGFRRLFERLHGRGFSGTARQEALVLYEPTRIAFAQVYAFILFEREFRKAYGVEFRFVPTDRVVERGIAPRHRSATHVLFQARLKSPPERLGRILDRIAGLPNLRRTAFLDSFANSDIRHARHLAGIDLYYKKAILVDPADLCRPTLGHTTLSETYAPLYGLEEEVTDWQVPPDVLTKLRRAPNFLTGPDLSRRFLHRPLPRREGRDIDLHARLGGASAGGWYGAMRRDAARRVEALTHLEVAAKGRVPKKTFMAEMARSKICFSPFGYGEVCWRDIEAMAAGAVLLKPDMSHLATEPDLYRDGETYLAMRWDLSDLEEKIAGLLADPDRRARIAETAWRRARGYLEDAGPVRTFGEIFG
jgi:hypothetical protein